MHAQMHRQNELPPVELTASLSQIIKLAQSYFLIIFVILDFIIFNTSPRNVYPSQMLILFQKLICEVKLSKCEAIYKGNIHQKLRKIMDDHLSNVQHLLKNWKKLDSFAAYFEQHFESTTSHMYLCNCMTFKLIKKLNLIEAIK